MAAKFKENLDIKISMALTVLVFLIVSADSAKLTVPRILLPYNSGVPTNYTLEVKEGGCFKWTSNRNDLVSVTPLASTHERSSCTTKAVVSSVSRYPERNHAVILAEDEKSGQVLRCDVVIDSLYSVEIVTTTRVLYLEDAPEVFEVMAKNEKGDTFSSLSGISFHWSLESDSTDAYGVLRFLKFADSVYKTPSDVAYWEKLNLHGYKILIEGSKTGTAKVTVKPSHSAFEHVQSDEVSLVIVANLILKPAYSYLLPGSKLGFHLELLKQGKPSPISLPSDQYYLEVVDPIIAELNVLTSAVTALKYGVTNIVVKDRYVTEKAIAYLPSSVIHVTPPSYITFSVSPGDKWSLEDNKNYFISVEVFDRNGHPIHITKDVQVSVQFPTAYFSVIMKTTNGTYMEVQTLTSGSCKIYGHLVAVIKDGRIMKIEPSVSASQDVTIYKGIQVNPSFTLLPWNPVVKPTYSVYLTASGGSGSFSWICRNSSLGSVYTMYENEEQKAKVDTFGLGTFQVVATDAHLSLFTGFAEISVQPVVDMKIIPKKVEVEVNGSLVLPLAMYGYLPDKTLQMFNDCNKIPVIVDIDEIQKFTHTSEYFPVPPTACQNLVLQCHTKGFNRVHVKYESDDIFLKRTIVVACYRKLEVIYPSHEIVMALGTSADIIFQGGPIPWFRCSTFFVKNSPEHHYVNLLLMQNKSDAVDVHKVHASCKEYGGASFSFSVGNQPCESNKFPAVSEVSYKIFCSLPHGIKIWPLLPSVIRKECPTSGENVIAIHNQQDLEIEVSVEDAAGRIFNNISSLDIKWLLSNNSLAQLSVNEGVEVKQIPTSIHKMKYFQKIHPYGLKGTLTVTASIVGYKSNYLEVVNLYKSVPVINSSLKFNIVEELEVDPKRVSLFNSPSNKVYLNITKGSGYFEIEANNLKKANTIYRKLTRQIEITPIETGNITISITDLCLGVKHESVALVHIYGISAIVVDVVDKVEIGKSVIATVEILNEENKKIPASLFKWMSLKPILASDHIAVNPVPLVDPNQSYATYKITGLSLGVTSFKIIANAHFLKGIQSSSQAYTLQVFAPLKLSPSYIVLAVGAMFQVLHSGGPQPHASVEFFTDDEDTAFVSLTGIVEAKKIGKTMLYGKAIGHSRSGNAVVFSEDKVVVNCISLQEIKIHAPLSRLVAGAEIPLYVTGVTENESPFTYGTAFPAAKFKWTVSNDKVASLYNMYNPVGLQETEENNFRVGLRAHEDGIVNVHVEVIMPTARKHILTNDIQIQVFKKLKLVHPDMEGNTILLSPNSQMKLKCNRIGSAKVTFEILSYMNSSVVTVDQEGQLIASSKTGSAILLVRATEEFGVIQQLSLIVKVENIAYLMVHPTEDILTTEWPLTTLPVGFTISFTVNYYDNCGFPFDAVTSNLKFRASRHNLVRISFGSTNSTLNAQIVKPGHTVLKVWDVETSIPADYIKLVTGSAIDPSEMQLTTGDVVCFRSSLLTKEGHKGTWASSKTMLSIHSVSGIGLALSKGSTTVTYSLLDGYSTSTEVSIQDASYISIEPGTVSSISNFPRTKPYKIPFIIQNNSSYRTNNIVGKNCSYVTEVFTTPHLVKMPFTCELSFVRKFGEILITDIFDVTSGFDIEKGMYFCSIEPINKITVSETCSLDSQLSMSVHLFSSPLDISVTHLLTFMPAFYVQQKEIILSEVQPYAPLIITAVAAIQRCIMVVPSDPSVLHVQPSNSVYPESLAFRVELRNKIHLHCVKDVLLHLDISCPMIKQLVQIPVKWKQLESSIDSSSYCSLAYSSESKFDWYSILTVLTAIFVSFLCVYVVLLLTSSRRGNVTTQPVFLDRSSDSHPFTIVRTPCVTPTRSPQFSPSVEDVDNLSGPLRLCSLDNSPKSVRKRFDTTLR